MSPIWSVNSPARSDISLNFLEPASPLNSIAASSCFNSRNSAFRLLFLFAVFCICSPNSVIAASATSIFCESAANSSLFGSSEFKIDFAKSTPAANCWTALSVFSNCFSKIPSAVGSISISSFALIPFSFLANSCTFFSSNSTFPDLKASASSFPACFPRIFKASKSFVSGFNFCSTLSIELPDCVKASVTPFPVSFAVASTLCSVSIVSLKGFFMFVESMPTRNKKSSIPFLIFYLLFLRFASIRLLIRSLQKSKYFQNSKTFSLLISLYLVTSPSAIFQNNSRQIFLWFSISLKIGSFPAPNSVTLVRTPPSLFFFVPK